MLTNVCVVIGDCDREKLIIVVKSSNSFFQVERFNHKSCTQLLSGWQAL